MNEQGGRHAEIKRRYSRKWDTKLKPDRIRAVRRKQVLHLLRDRHGTTIPDDARGRAALQLLFELGLDAPAAQELAPWADGDEIEQLIAAANDNWAAWSPDEDATITEKIGARVAATFDEFKRLRLTHVRPCDVPRHQVNEYLCDCKAARDRLRKTRDRALAKQGKSAATPPDPWDLPDGRAKSLAIVPLGDRQWWTVRALAEHALGRLGAFAELDHAAARRAVLRAVRKLEKLGIIETKTEAGPRGLKVLHVRRPLTPAEAEEEHQDLLSEVAAEQACER